MSEQEEKVIDSLINIAKETCDSYWTDVYKKNNVNHCYDLSKDVYDNCLVKLKPIMKTTLLHIEKKYLANSKEPEEPESYPRGCKHRASRSWPLFKRWDALFRKIINAYEVYS